MHGEIVVVVL